MELMDILDENLICTNLEVVDKADALMKMSGILQQYGYIANVEAFYEDVMQREKLGETGIGNYVAIPHGQSDSVIKSTICICKLKNEITWETLDGKGIRIILLFAVQNDVDFAKTHLLMLASVARKLANEETIMALLNAESKDEIMQCFK